MSAYHMGAVYGYHASMILFARCV